MHCGNQCSPAVHRLGKNEMGSSGRGRAMDTACKAAANAACCANVIEVPLMIPCAISRGDRGGLGRYLQGSGGVGGKGSFVITPSPDMVVCQLVSKWKTWISEAQEESLTPVRLQPAAWGLLLTLLFRSHALLSSLCRETYIF